MKKIITGSNNIYNNYFNRILPFGGLTLFDAKLYVPINQPGIAYSGTLVLTFGNQ